MAYLDGELASARAAEAVAHLERCGECQRLAEELRGVSREMTAWEVEGAEFGLRDAPDLVVMRAKRRWWVWGVAAAAAVVVVVTTVSTRAGEARFRHQGLELRRYGNSTTPAAVSQRPRKVALVCE